MSAPVYNSFQNDDFWDEVFAETAPGGLEEYFQLGAIQNDNALDANTSGDLLPISGISGLDGDQPIDLPFLAPKSEDPPVQLNLAAAIPTKVDFPLDTAEFNPHVKSGTELQPFTDVPTPWHPAPELMGLISGENEAFGLSLTSDVYRTANHELALNAFPVYLRFKLS